MKKKVKTWANETFYYVQFYAYVINDAIVIDRTL